MCRKTMKKRADDCESFFSLQVLKLIIFEFMEGSRRSIRKKGPAHIQLGLSAMSIVFKLPTKIRYNLESFMGLGAQLQWRIRTPHFVKSKAGKMPQLFRKMSIISTNENTAGVFQGAFYSSGCKLKIPQKIVLKLPFQKNFHQKR